VIDSVLSYHMNAQTCGVAKWNHALARRLGVPCRELGRYPNTTPLVSIKTSEIKHDPHWYTDVLWYATFDLFLHDEAPGWTDLLRRARHIYAANSRIAATVRKCLRREVFDAFCPATIEGNPTRGTYRVLTFGMAHKLNLPHFQALKQELELTQPDYTIELSTAVHEGNPWDQALTESVEAMRGIFGDKLRVLGFLGDDAMAKELREVDAVACYFAPALRANNTSYWAAVDAGKTIYTNRDEHSPQEGDPPASWDRLVQIIQGAA
jgi:hypothetical protein